MNTEVIPKSLTCPSGQEQLQLRSLTSASEGKCHGPNVKIKLSCFGLPVTCNTIYPTDHHLCLRLNSILQPYISCFGFRISFLVVHSVINQFSNVVIE